MSVLVLVGDARGFSRHTLSPSRALRRIACLVVRREGLREDPVSPISPTTVVLDNLVGDRGHVSLLSAALFVRRGWDAKSSRSRGNASRVSAARPSGWCCLKFR